MVRIRAEMNATVLPWKINGKGMPGEINGTGMPVYAKKSTPLEIQQHQQQPKVIVQKIHGGDLQLGDVTDVTVSSVFYGVRKNRPLKIETLPFQSIPSMPVCNIQFLWQLL